MRVQLAQGELAAASTTLEQVKERFPNHPAYPTGAVAVATARGEYEAASTLLHDLLDQRKQSPFWSAVAHRMLAPLAAVRGRIAEAESHFEEAARLYDLQGDVLQALGTRLEHASLRLLVVGDTAGALALADRVQQTRGLAAIPEEERPYAQLVWFYAVADRPARARELLAARPADPTGWTTAGARTQLALATGALALAENRPGEAIVALRRASTESECVTCGLALLGRAYETAGWSDSAVAVYTQYLDAYWADRTSRWPELPFDAQGDAWWRGYALERLALLYELSGRESEARARWAELAELWRDADPLLRQRAERAARSERLPD